jgi:hypothetical protein
MSFPKSWEEASFWRLRSGTLEDFALRNVVSHGDELNPGVRDLGGHGRFFDEAVISSARIRLEASNWCASLLGRTFAEIVTSALRSMWCSSICVTSIL